ncbi:MAG: SufE family protein [Alphaproteobacteria bacterium]
MNTQELIENFSFLDNWEDKYRYIIELGEKLKSFDNAFKTDEYKVEGCQSQVWLKQQEDDSYIADSDALIVKGLLYIVLIIYNENKNADINDIFTQTGLLEHLSPSRRNGLFAVIEKIKYS